MDKTDGIRVLPKLCYKWLLELTPLEILKNNYLSVAPLKGKDPTSITHKATPKAQMSVGGPENYSLLTI